MRKRQQQKKEAKAGRSQRVSLSAKESLKRLEEFQKRKEQFIATVRKGEDRGVSA